MKTAIPKAVPLILSLLMVKAKRVNTMPMLRKEQLVANPAISNTEVRPAMLILNWETVASIRKRQIT